MSHITHHVFRADVANKVPTISILAVFPLTFIFLELAQMTKVVVNGPLVLLSNYSRAKNVAHKV